MTARDRINVFGVGLAAIRELVGEDWVIINIGARGPNYDMPEGNMFATLRRGNDEATAEAKYLFDAMSLASGKIDQMRKARADAKVKGGAE